MRYRLQSLAVGALVGTGLYVFASREVANWSDRLTASVHDVRHVYRGTYHEPKKTNLPEFPSPPPRRETEAEWAARQWNSGIRYVHRSIMRYIDR